MRGVLAATPLDGTGGSVVDSLETLREQVASTIAIADGYNPNPDPALWELDRDTYLRQADAVLAVFAERERLLRERIEALTIPLFEQGSSARIVLLDDVLAVFDDES